MTDRKSYVDDLIESMKFTGKAPWISKHKLPYLQSQLLHVQENIKSKDEQIQVIQDDKQLLASKAYYIEKLIEHCSKIE